MVGEGEAIHMKVKVEYKSDVLGKDIFWEGDPNDYMQIENYSVRRLVRLVARDEKTHKCGMWTASVVKEDK